MTNNITLREKILGLSGINYEKNSNLSEGMYSRLYNKSDRAERNLRIAEKIIQSIK